MVTARPGQCVVTRPRPVAHHGGRGAYIRGVPSGAPDQPRPGSAVECPICDGNARRCSLVSSCGGALKGGGHESLDRGDCCAGGIDRRSCEAVYLAEPAPAPIYGGPAYAAPPVVVAPTHPWAVGPSAAYAYVPTPTGSVVVNPRTGRTCRVEPDGYRWCWTP